uniref:DUF423 domain-containing protein n=1 Tax=Arcella intermedia TaxID=1963864 RepID=A0A6B2LT54_9EUKA|eukprot:TRINITY_DN7674_c0_g1_i2.p1 TRINITY_DN7674_c0_g1~~TRINITY_DN7674_c0_g1_i2.p1  ORF type:complete len:117 (-),score=15.87 TRINITY_DN7674_c0_g1_i2:30-380(-)
MDKQFWWKVGCLSTGLAVVLGAFGAHGLKKMVSDQYLLDIWNKGVLYHFIHSLGILISISGPAVNPRGAVLSFAAGTSIFSGSLYLMTLTNKRWLGAITPIGGVLFIAGWVLLAFS